MNSWLAPAGAAAALPIGLLVLAGAGWRGLTVLVVFLATSSWLTPGGGRRRPAQVFANGGVAAACAALALRNPAWLLGFAGAVAAAAADTWSTEIGRRSTQMPRLITSWQRVPAGTSGGITAIGSLGGIGGALVIALASWATGLVGTAGALAVLLAGTTGMLVDSLLGATVQVRFHCADCGATSETPHHHHGTPRPVRGIPWITTDMVNFLATLAGALATGVLWV